MRRTAARKAIPFFILDFHEYWGCYVKSPRQTYSVTPLAALSFEGSAYVGLLRCRVTFYHLTFFFFIKEVNHIFQKLSNRNLENITGKRQVEGKGNING